MSDTEHVCGLEGFNPFADDICPACEANREAYLARVVSRPARDGEMLSDECARSLGFAFWRAASHPAVQSLLVEALRAARAVAGPQHQEDTKRD